MRRKRLALFALVALVAIALPALIRSRPALAEPRDAGVPIVVDGAHKLDVARVQSEAQRLTSLGVDVYVRTFTSYDAEYGNLHNYIAALVKQTSAWQNPDGQPKSNLLIISIALSERQTDITYGDAWFPSLQAGDQYLRVQTGFINPRLRDGDFTGGVIAGLDQCYGLINNQLHPSSGQPGPYQPAPSPPADLSGLWRALLYIVLAGLALIAAFGAWRAAILLRKAQTDRQDAQAEARQKQNQADVLATTLQGETLQGLQMNLAALDGTITPEQLADFRAQERAVEQAVTSVIVRYGSLTPLPPDGRGISTATLRRIIRDYSQAIGEMEAVQGKANALDGQLQDILEAIAKAPDAIAKARDEIKQARDDAAAVFAHGFKTGEVDAIIAQADAAVSAAAAALEQRQFVKALKLATGASTQARAASQAAQDLPRKKDQFMQDAAALQQRCDRIHFETLPLAQAALRRMQRKYAQSAWEAVGDHPGKIDDALQQYAQELDEAKAHASDERQEWTAAFTSLASAGTALTTAEHLVDELTQMETRLAAAQADLPRKLALARDEITRAQQYLDAHAELNGRYSERMHEAQAKLDQSGQAAQAQLPDVLVAVALAEAATAEADGVLSTAQDEVRKLEEEQRDRYRGPGGPGRVSVWPIFLGGWSGNAGSNSGGNAGRLGGWGGGSTGWGGGGLGGGSTGWGGGGGGGGSTGW